MWDHGALEPVHAILCVAATEAARRGAGTSTSGLGMDAVELGMTRLPRHRLVLGNKHIGPGEGRCRIPTEGLEGLR